MYGLLVQLMKNARKQKVFEPEIWGIV